MFSAPAISFKALQAGILAALAVATCLIAVLGYVVSEVRFEPIKLDADKYLLEVPAGQGLAELSKRLEQQGMIESAWKFNAYARAVGAERHILAGEYRIERGELVRELLRRLRSGDVATYRLTLIEGKRIEDVLALVAANEHLAFAENPPPIEALGTWLGLPWPHGEGGIMPDTYVYTGAEDGKAVLMRAAKALQAALDSAWESRHRDLTLASSYELLILASIIEKESGTRDDSFRISRVFANRLGLGMRLQADPTVIYGMGEAYTGRLLRRDLKQDTPYNTYTRHGLPPTPIAIVSPHSLHAAANPRKGPWKYFVARGDGSSEFSTSLSEHNRAVRRYVKQR